MFSSRFGIKSKIVLTILAIVTITTAFNLYYTYKTFKSDKEAYVFDSAQRASDIAIEKITLFLNPIITNLQKTIKDQDLVNENLKLYFEFNGDTLSFGKKHENYSLDRENLSKSLKNKILELKNGVSYLSYDDHYVLTIKKGTISRSAILDLNDLKNTLEADPVFNYDVKIGPYLLIASDKLKGLEEGFIGTKVFMDNLVAKSKNDSLGINVISYISTDKAFSILKVILIKNISFAAIVLGICLILSLYASNKFTTPILKIIAKTEEIAEGNYENELLIETNDELENLGSSVNTMSKKIQNLLSEKEEMIRKLDDYNKNLEFKVQERTRELNEANIFIKTMINSLNQGLFVFGNDNMAKDIYTNACIDLFGTNPANKNVTTILQLPEKESANFEKWSNIVFSNMLPFESAKELGPKNFIIGKHGEDNFRHVDLTYFSMDDEDGNIQNIVAVATDKTAEVKAEKAFKEKDLYVSMIMKLVKDKEAFLSLFSEVKNMIADLKNNLDSENLLNRAMIVFHTMNGGFAAYSAMDLNLKARESEERIKTFSGATQEFKELIQQLIVEYELLMENFYQDTILTLFSNKNIVEIEKEELSLLEERLKNISKQAHDSFNDVINKKRISKFFDSYSNLINTLSEKLDKPMKNLIVNDNGIRITPKHYNEYFSSLVHLFRNCMDHGIESKDQRLEHGKEEEGVIKVEVVKQDNSFKIKIQDDGAGLNLDKIKEKLCSIMDPIKVEQMEIDELSMAIFLPNFSTRDTVSELSGRGIGMSAIKDAVDKLSGKLEVKTEPNKGSEFTFTLPLL